LVSDVNYKNGKFFDTIKFYFPNGQLNFKEYYDEKGFEQGEFKLWFASGKLRQYCNMVNGKIIGKTTDYYESGQIEEIGFYDNMGRRDSTWSYYSANGKLIKSEKYKADSLLKTIADVK
jgi:antitoxin component YwqK of YwqJK toxin-antitoxin module